MGRRPTGRVGGPAADALPMARAVPAERDAHPGEGCVGWRGGVRRNVARTGGGCGEAGAGGA